MSGAEVSTCNMAEALYLLQRGNHVVRARMACTWPCGLEECSIVFEGESVEADHWRYVETTIPVDLHQLPLLFSAITAALEKAGEP
jgi:hypothetical protein